MKFVFVRDCIIPPVAKLRTSEGSAMNDADNKHLLEALLLI